MPTSCTMYDEATARKLLQEAVIVSAEDAVDGPAVVGFEPNGAALDRSYQVLQVGNKSDA